MRSAVHRGALRVESSSQRRRWHTLRAAGSHDFPQQDYLSLIFKQPTNRGFTKVHDGTSAGPNADQRFVSYYAEQSASAQTKQRFEGVRRATLDLRATLGLPVEHLDIADVGCGAGTQTLMWSAAGHRARGVDISAPLIELARERAEKASASAQFHVGSATKLPFDDASLDVVLVSELLEHIADWQPCIDEAVRVLRPGGIVYISTTNWLCPVQQEFKLPAYSWYPGALKRYCERLAVTTHGHWVQFTSFPAVHWFSFFQLRDYLDARGVTAKDRFDVMQTAGSFGRRAVVRAIQSSSALRFAAHVMTPYTVVVGYRRPTDAPSPMS